MKRTAIIAAVIGFALATALTTSANAQGARSFVSAHGNDGNTCSIVAPCRTFAAARTSTARAGATAG